MDDKEQAAIDALRAAGLEDEARAVEQLRGRHKETMDAYHAGQRSSYTSGQADERERCARLCESLAVFAHPMARQGNPHSMQYMGAQLTEGENHMALACAKRIRGA